MAPLTNQKKIKSKVIYAKQKFDDELDDYEKLQVSRPLSLQRKTLWYHTQYL